MLEQEQGIALKPIYPCDLMQNEKEGKEPFVFDALPQMEYEFGEFHLIASPSSRGKSTLMATMAANALRKSDAPPVVFLALQEGGQDAYTRICESLVFQEAMEKNCLKKLEVSDSRVDGLIFKAARGEGDRYLIDAVARARELMKAAGNAERWHCYERVRKIKDVERLLGVHPGAIVFLDAAYELENERRLNGFKDFNVELEISYALKAAAGKNRQLIIASSYMDGFGFGYNERPALLQRDLCGKYGMLAYSVVGLGINSTFTKAKQRMPKHKSPVLEKGEPCFFWKMMKNRRWSDHYERSFFFDTRHGALGYSCLMGTDSSADCIDDARKPKEQREHEYSGARIGWDGEDCIHLHACRRMSMIAREQGVQLTRGCGKDCSAYESDG